MREADAFDRYGVPYHRDSAPFRVPHPLDDYPVLPPTRLMPDTLKESVSMGWQKANTVTTSMPDHRVNVLLQILMAKQHAKRHRTFSPIGHIFWVRFTAIEGCWMLLDEHDDYKLLNESEYKPRPLGV